MERNHADSLGAGRCYGRDGDGDRVRVRQSTEAEKELAVIYSLLDINANPIGKVKSVVHPNPPPKNPPPENQGVP